MTRTRVKELLEVMQAYSEGQAIEWRNKGESKWRACYSPSWSDDTEYRIKPLNEAYQGLANRYHWYIAKDMDGSVYAYNRRPTKGPTSWKADCETLSLCLSSGMFKGFPLFEGKWDHVLIAPKKEM